MIAAIAHENGENAHYREHYKPLIARQFIITRPITKMMQDAIEYIHTIRVLSKKQ